MFVREVVGEAFCGVEMSEVTDGEGVEVGDNEGT